MKSLLDSRSTQSDSGVGLTELAVAIVVLGIVLVGIFPAIVDSLSLAVRNNQIAQANQVLSSQIALQRTALSGGVCVPSSGAETVTLNPARTDFSATRTVSCSTSPPLATVTVTVTSTVNSAVSVSATTKVWTG